MGISAEEKIDLIKIHLEKMDAFSGEFEAQIQGVVEKHKREGSNIEFAYVEHFHNEIIGLSKLFQYLLKNEENRKYVFFPVRASIEVLLTLEHVLELSKQGGDKVLSLLSKDMAQSVAALDEASPTDPSHKMHSTIRMMGVANKIIKTDFDLEKIKSNTKVFPDIRSLCNKSNLSLKDLKGGDIYHIYKMYSESNHLRLTNHHSISNDANLDCWALEYFIEIYIRFYELILNTGIFPTHFVEKLNSIKNQAGIK